MDVTQESTPMATSQSTIEYFFDQLSGLPNIRVRKMFGEHALYCDENVVALGETIDVDRCPARVLRGCCLGRMCLLYLSHALRARRGKQLEVLGNRPPWQRPLP